ncbi:thioredoxin [Oscillatoria acuminata]|uniref:Thioredoxin n=1 Tax=Oscillatoria acuminata PCC 6304 TaxID=56110 RepID=K9TR62_9CYAN|nr:thioredoxin [Oscillatoria acuminata]AFY84504.1 thioredoxin [Oscillatoria acuminata PCC 6304]
MTVKKQFASFEEMLTDSEVPVLVDFYAAWCGPCQMMGPVLDEVNARLKNRIQVVKIDTEKYQDLATEHRIYALPTLVLFKNGKPLQRFEGFLSAEQLIPKLESLL